MVTAAIVTLTKTDKTDKQACIVCQRKGSSQPGGVMLLAGTVAG